MGEHLKILELRAENVKRLNAIQVKPVGNVVLITGDNNEGKSSLLDSIMMTLAGKEAQPPVVIHRGADYAETLLDMGAWIARRRWTKGGDKLTVEARDGARYQSPQKMIDDLLGKISFDPLAFIRLPAGKQAETVKKMVGIDTTAIEAAYRTAYEERTKVNASGQSMKARFEALPAPAADVPDEPISIDDLLNEQATLQAEKEANDKARANLAQRERAQQVAEAAFRAASEVVERLERELAAARVKEEEAQLAEGKAQEAVDEVEEDVLHLVDPEISEIVKKISRADATNAAVRLKKERAAMHAQLEAERQKKIALDTKIEGLEAEKARMIAEAKFPIDGMSFSSDGGLTFNGLPLEQASSSEQLRVGIALSIALNPTIRVAFIRDGSLLDEKSMAMVEQMAEAHDMQIWIERVGAGPVGFEIVDGYVVAVDGKPVEKPEPLGKPPPKKAEDPKPEATNAAPAIPATLNAAPAAEPTPPPGLVDVSKAPTFKKRPIPSLTAEELHAAMAEVGASIKASPGKATRAQAVYNDLSAEVTRRMHVNGASSPGEPPEPGSDG